MNLPSNIHLICDRIFSPVIFAVENSIAIQEIKINSFFFLVTAVARIIKLTTLYKNAPSNISCRNTCSKYHTTF